MGSEMNSPSLANSCMQKVRMAISFILKSSSFLGDGSTGDGTGKSKQKEQIGEMRLSEYLSSVLAETSETIPSAAARSEVCLWHLASFEAVLKDVINFDPTESIDPKYRVPLPEELLDKLLA